MLKLKSFIFIFVLFFFATCQQEIVHLNTLSTNYIGRKGAILIASSSYYRFNKDPTRKIDFQAKISYNQRDVDCGLWNPKEYNLYVFCNINTDIPAGKYSLNFTKVPSFNYQGHNLRLEQEYYSTFEFEKYDRDIIDLYSEEQTINIVSGVDIYNLQFNVVSYNQEGLMLKTLGYIFMNCTQGYNVLNCQITKNDLEKGLYKNNFTSDVYYTNETATYGISSLPYVGQITIIDNIERKIDVYVGITRLLENVVEGESNMAYETNVTYINKVITSVDHLSLRFINEYYDTGSGVCSLRKYDDNPLLIVCFPPDIGTCWLDEIKTERNISNANLKYNFIIQPVKNVEKIYHSNTDRGVYIDSLFPETLYFSSNSYLYIYYVSKEPEVLKGITFNKDKGDLNCDVIGRRLLKCKVPKSHFDKDGYYFTKHTNHLDRKSVFYDSNPVKVILKGSFYTSYLYYSLLLIIIMF